MRFEVPQFIEIEDKIFGPLTWKQFLYLGGGVGMAVVIFLTTNFIVFVLLGLPIALLALALSFYKVNSRDFSHFLEAMFNYVTRQRMYFWRKKDGVVYSGHTTKTSDNGPIVRVGNKDISSIARRLEMKALEKNES